jgi:hypothetical protein
MVWAFMWGICSTIMSHTLVHNSYLCIRTRLDMYLLVITSLDEQSIPAHAMNGAAPCGPYNNTTQPSLQPQHRKAPLYSNRRGARPRSLPACLGGESGICVIMALISD